jgi:hypothetical protein
MINTYKVTLHSNNKKTTDRLYNKIFKLLECSQLSESEGCTESGYNIIINLTDLQAAEIAAIKDVSIVKS